LKKHISDPERRKKYDQFRTQWLNYRNKGGKPESYDWEQWRADPERTYSYRTVTPEEFAELFGSAGGYSDFFETLFGGTGQRRAASGVDDEGFPSYARSKNGHDREYKLSVSLYEAFSGATRSFRWEDGRTINAKIPRGVQTGSRVRLKRQGEPSVHGGVPGDLFLIIEVLPDSRFLRKDDDLETTISVDLFTLLLGGSVTVAGIDRSVRLDIPAETPNGRIFRLKGLGMPVLKNPEKRGNLYVAVNSELPKHLSAEEKDLIQQWEKLR
jgi:curved DNA-binding protein